MTAIIANWAMNHSSFHQRKRLVLPTTGHGPKPSHAPSWAEKLARVANASARKIAVGTGLLITSMIGSTINPNNGDYSRGAAGFWVENGQIMHPVNECTVAGNLREFLLRMTPANDARDHLSRRVPSLLVEGLTIAGA